MPFIDGSTTASTAAAVTAASMALPPPCNTFRPAADANAWLVAIMPCRPTAADLVPRMLPAGRSPGAMVALVVVMIGCDCSGGGWRQGWVESQHVAAGHLDHHVLRSALGHRDR